MNIAVCMYGYPNYIFENFEYHKKFYDGLKVDYYCHFWTNHADSRDIAKEILIKKTLHSKNIIFEIQKKFKNSFDFEIDLTKTTRTIPNTISTLYSIKKVGKILEDTVNKQNKKYDYIVCTRPDICCLDLKFNEVIKNNNTIYSSYVDGDEWVVDKGGNLIDAKLICSGYENMIHFFKIYDFFEDYMKKEKISLCHHRLFCHHLKKINKKFELLYSNNWYFYRNFGLSKQ